MKTLAQRTSDGERAIALWGGTTFSSWGGELYYGEYLLPGYWFAGAGLHDRLERDIPSRETVHYPRLQARGGFMYRLLSDYSRSVNLYIGGDVFIGVEMLDWFRRMSPTTRQAFYNNGYRDYQFIYGTAPRAELEFFLLPSIALVAGGRFPFCFGSPFPTIGWELSIGAKLNF